MRDLGRLAMREGAKRQPLKEAFALNAKKAQEVALQVGVGLTLPREVTDIDDRLVTARRRRVIESPMMCALPHRSPVRRFERPAKDPPRLWTSFPDRAEDIEKTW